MSEAIINKIASSGLITIDLEKYLPKEDVATFDLKDHLFMGLILKEKDFREALKNLEWSIYRDKYVAITCSADAIIPAWAYMLVVTYLDGVAKDSYVGTAKEMQARAARSTPTPTSSWLPTCSAAARAPPARRRGPPTAGPGAAASPS